MDSWSDMFAARARRSGLMGAGDIAAALCKVRGRSDAATYEVTRRSVSNWLSGTNRPSRDNLRALNTVLGMDQRDPEWGDWVQGWKIPPTEALPTANSTRKPMLLAAIAGLVMLGIGAVLYLRNAPVDELPFIPFRPVVITEPGAQMVIHGARAHCDQGEPPAPAEITATFPQLSTGALAVGQIGQRSSKRCGGLVMAREIIYSAQTIGVDHIQLFGDQMAIFVLARSGR